MRLIYYCALILLNRATPLFIPTEIFRVRPRPGLRPSPAPKPTIAGGAQARTPSFDRLKEQIPPRQTREGVFSLGGAQSAFFGKIISHLSCHGPIQHTVKLETQ